MESIQIPQTDGKNVLPLHDLVALLRLHGFTIKPDDYIELLKVVETFGPETLEEGAPLLCPLIATSPEEQERFYKVFEQYKILNETAPALTPAQKRKRWLIQNLWWITGSMVLVLALLAYMIFFRKPRPSLSAGFHYQKVSIGDARLRVSDTLELNAGASFLGVVDSTANIQYFWNTGNGFRQGKPVEHLVLSEAGRHTIQLKIRSTNRLVKDSIFSDTLDVCAEAPRVQFVYNKTDYSVGDTAVITPVYFSNLRFRRQVWKANSSIIQPDGKGVLRLPLDTGGIYAVSFTGLLNEGDSEQAPCAYVMDLYPISAQDQRYTINTAYGGARISHAGTRTLQPLLYWLLLLPAVLISVATILWWNLKRKSTKGEKEPPLFKGRKPPYETPFENKDLKLAETEYPFQEIFRSFRQKAEDEITTFNISQSIQRTIRTGGIPELVFSNRLRYNDYIILIDRSLAKSMQVRLFDYLVRLFDEEAINVERYYYTGNLEKIFNESEPNGISLKRLSELYKTYTLIIMGNAHQLVYSAYPALEKNIVDVLMEWEYKAILTPAPYKDWGEKEALIVQKFVLLPADLQGQIILIKAIREKRLDHKKYLSSIDQFYETEYYDFNTIDDLKTYLNDEVLFQWLCAVAVFHKLRWEIVIEIGKTICARYEESEKMNFTNLLKLSRISWMNEGAFPAATRLELLKALTPENEVAARETLLHMMQFADMYYGSDYFFEEEKEIQKITSQFLLYATDPVRYAGYEEDQQKFKTLWERNELWDTAQRTYLENTEGKWPTLIQHKGKSVSLNSFFNFKKIEGLRSERRVLWRNGMVAGLFVLVILFFNLFKNRLPESSIFIKTTTPPPIVLNFSVQDSISCGRNNALQSITGQLQTSKGDYPLDFKKDNTNHFLASLTLPLDDSTALLSLNGQGKTAITASRLISLGNDQIRVGLSACYDSSAYKFNIVLHDSTHQQEASEISAYLNSLGFGNSGIQYGFSDDSSGVYFHQAASESIARSVATALSLQFPYLFPKGIRTNAINTDITGTWKANNQGESATFILTQRGAAIDVKVLAPDQNAGQGTGEITGSDVVLRFPLYGLVTTVTLKLSDNGNQMTGGFMLPNSDVVQPVNLLRQKDTPTKNNPQNNEISIVLNFPKRNGNSNIAWTQASLNSSLNEIWKGATNNRLITMDLSNQLLYYSTGIKSTFGTYRIQAVLYNGRGVYKILTQAGKQFQAFLLRSPRRNSFELSVCSTRYNSMSELQAASDTVCNPYDVMTLYYETDANKIFLPLNTNNLLEASNQSKLQRLNTPVQSAKSPYGNAKISGRLYYNSRFKWKIPDRLPIQITQTIPIQGATPFDRSYITYTSNRAASDYPSDNLNTTGYEQNAYPALSTPPNLISPAEGQTFNIIPRTTRLVWNSVRGASAYKVEIEYGYASKSQELTWTAFGKPVTVKDTTYSFEFGGAQPGRWRVSTINANTNASSPSPWRTFNFLR